MATENKNEPTSPVAPTSDIEHSADLGKPYPEPMRELAKDQPDGDPVLAAYKKGFLADSTQEEAKAKVKIVDESPRAADTPSGTALKKVAGISNDAERGEKYAQERGKVRWGYEAPSGS
jgi:hypothetical protein